MTASRGCTCLGNDACGGFRCGPKVEPRRDRAGFTRRWGVHVFREPLRAPWISVGVHLDWHTPSLDLYLFRFVVQIGRNMHDAEGRFAYAAAEPSNGHTDQCLCWQDATKR